MFSMLKEYLPTVTIALTLIGFFDLYFYFRLFNIDIYNFLDVVEIIFSFSSIFLYFVGLVLALLLLYASLLIMVIPFSRNEKLMGRLERLTNARRKFKTSKFAMYGRRFFGIAIVLIFISFLVDKFFFPYSPVYETEIVIMFGALFIGGLVLVADYPKEALDEVNASTILVALLAFFMTFIAARDYFKFKNVVHGFPATIVTLTMGDDTHFTSGHAGQGQAGSGLYFIGATKGFYFFWNKVNRTTQIIPVSEIKRIELFSVPTSMMRK